MTDCPSLLELTTTSLADDASLRAHVADCARCTALLAVWARQTTDDELDDLPPTETSVAPATTVDLDAGPTSGAVHAVMGEGTDRYLVAVVVDFDDEEATVLPVSVDVDLAGDWDAVLEADAIGYPATVEVWNHVTVLREQVGERLAVLGDDLASRLDAAYDAALRSGKWPGGLLTGPVVAGPEDPRSSFRREETLRMRPYDAAWRRIADAPTLGSAVAARREDRDESLEEVAASVSIDAEMLAELEGGRLDLRRSLPVSDLGAAVAHLELPPGARLYRLVEEHVFVNDRTPEPGQQATFARRRRGTASAGGPPPSEETRRRNAREYVARLRQRLEP